MSALLYLTVALLLLFATDRCVSKLSRGVALALLLLPLCFTGRALLTGAVYAPIDLPYMTPPLGGLKAEMGIGDPHNVTLSDLETQIIPWRQAVRSSIHHGQWPVWNVSILSGEILAAAAQPAAYSPFTLLALLLPVAHGLTFSAAITFFLAGVAAFLFARELGCREIVAIIAGAGWMYSTAISFFILWPLGASWALLPLLLLAARRVALEPSIRSASLLTVALLLLLLSGHPETVLHATTCAAAYGVAQTLRGRQKRRSVAYAIVAGVVALLVCAIYLLPLLDAVPQSAEHEFRTNVWAARPRGIDAANSAARLATDLVPYLHLRKWRAIPIPFVLPDTAGAGSLVLAAAVFAVWRVRSRESWFFTALVVFCLIARAEPPWFETLMQKLPGFDVALNSRFSFGAAFSLVILAALGLEHIARERERGFVITCLVVLATLAALTFITTRMVDPRVLPWGQAKIAAELAGLGAAMVLFATRLRVETQLTLFLALLLLQRTAEEGRVYPTLPARAAYPPVPLFEPMRDARAPFRIVGSGDAFPPGTSAMYGLQDVRGYEPLVLARYVDTYALWCVAQPVWFNRVDDLTRPFLSFLNVRYAITGADTPIPDGWSERKTDRGARLLENTRVLDRAFVPRAVRLGLSDEEELIEMDHETDFSARAWIRAPLEKDQRDNGPGRVTTADRGGRLLLDATMQNSGWVVISEPAWKGWRAYVDGRPVRMQLANHAFLAVHVPAGRHDVRLLYLPRSFVIGRAITIGTLALIAVGCALSRLRGRVARSAV